jgi:hypothetical protein
MVPLRGWVPKGAYLRGFAPHGHWRTMTFLGVLRCDRLTALCQPSLPSRLFMAAPRTPSTIAAASPRITSHARRLRREMTQRHKTALAANAERPLRFRVIGATTRSRGPKRHQRLS